ncbi:DUF4277 domain-containing protein [Sporomusa carbonis]|uniref:DUF4277 domain-containing protein n=1 Tax=Sporomusa carbonis TaxID=3076075 RepID=UPI003C7B84B8
MKNSQLQDGCFSSSIPIVCFDARIQYAKKLDFVETINRSAAWDEKQCNLSPGQLALSVVFSTFADVRSPLYHIKNNFAHMDTAFLFGPGVTGDDFTDDAPAQNTVT